MNCLGNSRILVPTRSSASSCCIITLAEVIIWTNNEWWMVRKTVYVQMATFSRVSIPVMFVIESHQTKQKVFSMAKKTTHINQENRALLRFNFHVKYIKMVLLHLKYKILCSWFLWHNSYSDFVYHEIEIPTSYRNFDIQKPLKAILEFESRFGEHHIQK